MMRWIGLLICLLCMGCEGTDPPSKASPASLQPESMNVPTIPDDSPTPIERPGAEHRTAPIAESTAVTTGHDIDVDLITPLDAESRIVPRIRRRMNVDQLKTAFEQASGGISWTEGTGDREINLFESLARTLGKPDFAEATDEDLEPTVLFQKFLGDASRSVCSKMLTSDLSSLDSDQEMNVLPKLLIHVTETDTQDTAPDAVKANLQTLVQRFHGRRLTSEAPGLAHWHWLFRSSLFVSNSPTQAWLGVCVGLFTHPDFYMY